MKKNKKLISRLITAVLTLTLCLSMSLSVSAAEKAVPTAIEKNVASEGAIHPRGVLSGYGSQYTNGNLQGSFDFEVTGSGSPWAGCTVRFTGFPTGAILNYSLVEVSTGRVFFSHTFTIKDSVQADEGDHNIPLLNVSTGTYRLKWSNVDHTDNGTIHCHIY